MITHNRHPSYFFNGFREVRKIRVSNRQTVYEIIFPSSYFIRNIAEMSADIESTAGTAPRNEPNSDGNPSPPWNSSIDIEKLGRCRPDVFANG